MKGIIAQLASVGEKAGHRMSLFNHRWSELHV